MYAPSRRYRSYRREKRSVSAASKVLRFLLVLFLTYVIVDSLFLRSYKVGSNAMQPTIQSGDRLLATPLLTGANLPFGDGKLPGLRAIRRGDLVVVRPEYFEQTAWQEITAPFISFFTLQRAKERTESRGAYTSSSAVKRIIALPGDSVRMTDNTVQVKTANAETFVDEFTISNARYEVFLPRYPESWSGTLPMSGDAAEQTLGADEYFVVSDDRTSSHDSRFWGPVKASDILSRVIVRYWPLNAFGAP